MVDAPRTTDPAILACARAICGDACVTDEECADGRREPCNAENCGSYREIAEMFGSEAGEIDQNDPSLVEARAEIERRERLHGRR